MCKNKFNGLNLKELQMNKQEIAKILELHQKWLNDEEGGERADFSFKDLRGANLQGANLRWANLRGADLDFASIPLSCSFTNFKADSKLLKQLAYHICTIETDEEGNLFQDLIKEFANKSHLIEKYNLNKFE
jgi:uncharacterized protein YjbI with pentapeptide repeats